MREHSDVHVWRLFVAAIEAEKEVLIRDQLRSVVTVLEEQPRFLEIFHSPAMVIETRKKLITEIFTDQVDALVVQFLIALATEDEFARLTELLVLYDQLVRSYLEADQKVIEGVVYSAILLTEEQLAQLEAVFTKKVGKTVKLAVVVDESLIGGVRVELQNKVYDGTTRLQLAQLKESLRKVDLK